MKHSEALGETVAVAARTTFVGSWRAYLPLTKPTISLLVVVTALPSMLLAADNLPNPITIVATILGIFFASGSAAVFNHLVEADIDAAMKRTRARPVASGRVPQSSAFIFGAILGILGLLILFFLASPLAAFWALAANVFYVVIYTILLKPNTVQNIVIGGAAGAVGPLIGWAAVSGTTPWPAWALFGIIFLWTPPHFWALALKYKQDYAAAGIPMLPVIKGDETTRRQIFLYTLTLIPLVWVLYGFGPAGYLYLAIGLAATLQFAWLAFRLYRSHENTLAMPLFHYSCLYLFIVFGGLAVDTLLGLGA